MYILSAQGLVKSYHRRRVVDGVSLDVAPGEIVGLLGPNGAGKSTSFKMMCGLVRPDRGSVQLQGVDVTQWPLHRRSREGGMGYLPQQSSVFAKLSVQDNLKGMMQLLGFSRKQQKARTNELLEQFKIEHIRKSKAGKLSGGEKRRLEIARCLIAEPKIIMLDEPFAGIDPVTVQGVQVVIRDLAATGISVLITDHAAREILQITHRTYVVSEGRILCSGTPDQIVTHPEVRQKYLGDIEMPAAKTMALPTGRPAAAVVPAPQTMSPRVVPPAKMATAPLVSPPATSAAELAATAAPPKISTTARSPVPDKSPPPAPTPDNGIPTPASPVPTKRRSRKVVAPFKTTDV